MIQTCSCFKERSREMGRLSTECIECLYWRTKSLKGWPGSLLIVIVVIFWPPAGPISRVVGVELVGVIAHIRFGVAVWRGGSRFTATGPISWVVGVELIRVVVLFCFGVVRHCYCVGNRWPHMLLRQKLLSNTVHFAKWECVTRETDEGVQRQTTLIQRGFCWARAPFRWVRKLWRLWFIGIIPATRSLTRPLLPCRITQRVVFRSAADKTSTRTLSTKPPLSITYHAELWVGGLWPVW